MIIPGKVYTGMFARLSGLIIKDFCQRCINFNLNFLKRLINLCSQSFFIDDDLDSVLPFF